MGSEFTTLASEAELKNPDNDVTKAPFLGAFLLFWSSFFTMLVLFVLYSHLLSNVFMKFATILVVSTSLATVFFYFSHKHARKKFQRLSAEKHAAQIVEFERKMTEAKERGDFDMWDK